MELANRPTKKMEEEFNFPQFHHLRDEAEKSKKSTELAEAKKILAYGHYRGMWPNKPDLQKAKQYFEELAADKDAEAMNMLGCIECQTPIAEGTNYFRAFSLFERAAEQGNAHAVHNLGVMHHNGYGCEKNDDKAAWYFQRAKEKGIAISEHHFANQLGVGGK